MDEKKEKRKSKKEPMPKWEWHLRCALGHYRSYVKLGRFLLEVMPKVGEKAGITQGMLLQEDQEWLEKIDHLVGDGMLTEEKAGELKGRFLMPI